MAATAAVREARVVMREDCWAMAEEGTAALVGREEGRAVATVGESTLEVVLVGVAADVESAAAG